MRQKLIEIFGIGLVTLLFAVLLHKAYEKLGLIWLLAGLAIVAVIILVNVAIFALFCREGSHEKLNQHIQAIKDLMEPKRVPWLLPNAEGLAIESDTAASEVWVVSPDLRNDTDEAVFVPVVQHNASRGISYTYIVPDTDVINARLAELRAVFARNPERLAIRTIPEREFHLLSSTHITCHNPRGEGGKPGDVFLELPIQGRGWWVHMSRDDAALYIGRIASIVDGEKGTRKHTG